ncbi:hypothetical protein F4808DRAFT_423599 [Astrocystis sublimbata]|nr:hypothetical protein F4808DRAFT_423599 [Astrocystis sublimbata]
MPIAMGKILIYGATGYTGRIACRHAKDLGLPFLLGGRSREKITELASQLTTSYRVFDLESSQSIDMALENVEVLLNCAGPFTKTAEPLMAACIKRGIHYLDISAELCAYQSAEKLSEAAKRAGAMLLPGCGGSVAMLGCLTLHVLHRTEQAVTVDIALCVSGSMSRGSAISAAASLSPDCLQRHDGKLLPQDINNTNQFDFDDGLGSVSCLPVTLPDLITISKLTEAPNVRTYVRTSAGSFPTADLDAMPDGPTAEQRTMHPYHASVVVTEKNGTKRCAVLHTVNGYTFTGMASVEAAKRVLAGEVRGGFQTPAEMFGTNFVYSIPGSRIVDF